MKKVTFSPQKLTPPSAGNHGFNTVTLTPGLNEIPDADWEVISTHPVFRLYKGAIEMEEGELENDGVDETATAKTEDETTTAKTDPAIVAAKTARK